MGTQQAATTKGSHTEPVNGILTEPNTYQRERAEGKTGIGGKQMTYSETRASKQANANASQGKPLQRAEGHPCVVDRGGSLLTRIILSQV